MSKRIICAILSFALVLPAAAFTASAESFFPSVSAKAAVLIDADTGRVMFEKNAEIRLPMASTTKIMTAIVALEHGDPDDTVTVTKGSVGVEGSSIYLEAEEKLSLRELLYALLLASANDAATAIALHISGSVEAFASLMNKKAELLGLKNTHFKNPHGLDAEGHFTTAYDLAKITAAALKNKTFAEIVSTYNYNISGKDGGRRYLVNHNKLLRGYEGCIGVKTGYTKADGRCLVSAARRDGMTLIAVTLSAPDDWRDHKAMLDYGFLHYESVKLCQQRESVISLPDVSKAGNEIECVAKTGIVLTLPRGGEITQVIECPRFFWNTPKKGETVGRVIFYRNGKEIARTTLIVK